MKDRWGIHSLTNVSGYYISSYNQLRLLLADNEAQHVKYGRCAEPDQH